MLHEYWKSIINLFHQCHINVAYAGPAKRTSRRHCGDHVAYLDLRSSVGSEFFAFWSLTMADQQFLLSALLYKRKLMP